MPAWARYDAARDEWRLFLHIQPGAKKSEFVGEHADRLKIRIAAPPLEGRANAALIAFLSATLGVPQRQIEVAQGESGKQKTVLMRGLGADGLARLPPLS